MYNTSVLVSRASELEGLDPNMTCAIYEAKIDAMGQMDSAMMSNARLRRRFVTALQHVVCIYSANFNYQADFECTWRVTDIMVTSKLKRLY